MHHIVFRSERKAMENVKINQIYLCGQCHRGTWGVHGKYGSELNKRLKDTLEMLLKNTLVNDYYTIDELIEKLDGLNYNDAYALSKTIKRTNYKLFKDDIIRACMGR